MTDSEWMNTREVGTLIGQSGDNVRRMCESGVWPGAYQARPGAAWRVPRADVLAWLKSVQPTRRRRDP